MLILVGGCLKSGDFMSFLVGPPIFSRRCRKSSDLGAFLKLGSDSEYQQSKCVDSGRGVLEK